MKKITSVTTSQSDFKKGRKKGLEEKVGKHQLASTETRKVTAGGKVREAAPGSDKALRAK